VLKISAFFFGFSENLAIFVFPIAEHGGRERAAVLFSAVANTDAGRAETDARPVADAMPAGAERKVQNNKYQNIIVNYGRR